VVAEPEELNYLWFFFCVFLGSIVYVYISSAAAAALHQTNSKSERSSKKGKVCLPIYYSFSHSNFPATSTLLIFHEDFSSTLLMMRLKSPPTTTSISPFKISTTQL
jgi:hypothetical protein